MISTMPAVRLNQRRKPNSLFRARWSRSRRMTATICAVLVLVGAYVLAAATIDSRGLPSPGSIVVAFGNLLSGNTLYDEVLPSMERLAIGLVLSVVIGVVVGLVLGMFQGLDPWVRPVFDFLRAAPPPAILPGLIVLLGAGDTMRVTVIVITSVFAVAVNTMDGARRVEPILVDSARIAGLGRLRVIGRVILPASLPEIFVGIRVAIGLALIGTVLSELVAASAGIGVVLLITMSNFDLATGYAIILLLGILATVLMGLFKLAQHYFLSWHRGMLKAGQ